MESKNLIQKKEHKLHSLGLLRGIAVLMVCFSHFSHPLLGDHFFSTIFHKFFIYGTNGVHVFFVISGFVIPLSLFKGGYQLSDYGNFLYKRLLRLQPPYLAALALTFIIMYFSYHVRHAAFPETASSMLKSLAYFHVPADNPVFWTLIVEAQYYIFIGLFYIVLMRFPKTAICLTIPILILLSQAHIFWYINLFNYMVFFLIGTIGFLIYTNKGSRIYNFVGLLSLLAICAFYYELPAFISALLTIAFILTYKYNIPAMLQFPGKISYSVYLIHFPLGMKLINLLKPKIDPAYSGLLFLSTLLLVIVASWMFFKIFEEFSERLSKNVRYKLAVVKQPEKVIVENLALSH